ncbi:hypothetical protein ALISP_7356 [Alicycliphilus sp. B1]|nr:hypothetical protein ALISP_7356 [Alicycliphilus sp. B1]
MIAHDLRAGVAQASGEETAENANAGFRAQTLWGFGQRYGGQSSQASGANVPLRLDGDWRNCDGAPSPEVS